MGWWVGYPDGGRTSRRQMFNHRLGRLVVGGSVVVVGCGVVVVVGGIVVVEMTKNEQAGRRGWGLTLSFRLLFCFFFFGGEKKQKKVESVVVVQRMPFSSFWPGFHNRCLKGEKEEQNKKNSSRFNRTTHGCFACQHSQFFLVFLASSFNTIPATGFIAAFKPGCA